MTELKVDTVVNLAGTGKPNFENGVSINGAATSTLNLNEYTESSSEPSSPKNGSIWWDTANEKIFIYIAGEWKETIGIAGQIAWGGTRGFRLGGNNSNVIGYFDIQNSGNATDFGDLSVTKAREGGAAGNGTRIVQGLGFSNVSGSNAASNNLEYITCATTGNSTDFGDLTSARFANFAVSNGTRGVWGGGQNSSSQFVNTMDYVTLATTGNAIDFGDMYGYSLGGSTYSHRARYAAISNKTRGIFGGGANDYRSGGDEIQYITIASTGNASDFGNLSNNRANFSGCSDATRGLFMGGAAETSGQENINNNIDYITIDTTGNAADFGDLTYTSQGAAACADNTYGCHYGGYGAGYSLVNTIDRVTIQTLGNATDHGDLQDTALLKVQGASGNAS